MFWSSFVPTHRDMTTDETLCWLGVHQNLSLRSYFNISLFLSPTFHLNLYLEGSENQKPEPEARPPSSDCRLRLFTVGAWWWHVFCLLLPLSTLTNNVYCCVFTLRPQRDQRIVCLSPVNRQVKLNFKHNSTDETMTNKNSGVILLV